MPSDAPSLGTLGEALIAIRADLKSLRDDINKAKTVVKSGVDDIQKHAEKTGKVLSVALSAPILAIGGAAMLIAKEYDEAMDDIRASTGATGEKLVSLGASFKGVFKNVPNDAKDVSDAIIELNRRLGLSGPALDTMATQMLNLSRVGKTQLEPLVTNATRLFGIWSVATADQSQTLDDLFKVSQQTGAKVGDLIANVTQAAPTFKQFGFDITTSAALLGQWEKAGLNADTMVGGLRLSLVKFAKEGVDAKKGLQDIVDKMLAFGPGAASSKLAVDTFGRGAVAMTNAVFQGAFSVDALVKSVKASKETINTAAFDTLSFADKWKVLDHNVRAALEPLGTSLLSVFERALPLITGVADAVWFLAESFAAMPDAVQTTVIAIGGILALLGPGILIVVKFGEAFGKLAPVLKILGNTIPVLTARIWLMELATKAAATSTGAFILASGPLIVAIAAVTAAVVIGYQAWKLYSESRERAAAAVRQEAVDASNLERINKALGTSYTSLADAVAEVNRRRAAAPPPAAGAAAGKPDTMGAFLAELKEARDSVNALSSSQRNAAASALRQGADQKKVQEALGLSDLAMGLYMKSVDASKTKLEALTKAHDEYKNALDVGVGKVETFAQAEEQYADIIDRIGNATYEGIKFDHDRGISNGALAAQYQVTEKVVDQVIKSEEAFADALDATEASFASSREAAAAGTAAVAKSLEGMPAVLKNMAQASAVFDEHGGLVSGSLLLSHNLEAVNAQGELAGDVFYKAGIAMAGAMTATARAFLPLSAAQKKAVEDMKKLGFSAEEAAAILGLSLQQVQGRFVELRKEVATVLDSMATSLTQLAQVSGGAFGGLISDIAQVVVAMNAGAKAAEHYAAATTLAGKAAAVMEGVTAVAGATQGGGKKGVIGGALAGAQAGAMFGPWGMAIGAGIGALVGWLRTDRKLNDIMRDAGEKFGTVFSKATADAINAGVKAGKNELAAELMNLDKIIQDAGGLTAGNISKLTDRLRDTFVALGRGELTAAEATKILDQNFNTFVTAATSNVGVLSARIVDIIKLNKQFGTQSVEMAKYVQGQIGTNVFGGLTAGLSQGKDAAAKAKENQKLLLDLNKELLSAGVADQDAIRAKIAEVTKDLEKQAAIVSATSLQSQGAASASVGAILAGIAELQSQGVDFVTAMTQAQPAIEALREQLAQTGFDGGAAFAQLVSYVELASDEIAGPALKAAAGFGQALVGLNNSGLLTQDMFAGLASQIAATRDNLVAQGKDGGAVLRLLAPQLQQIWEIQRQTGMAVDDTTQSLIDEAEAQGLVGEKFLGPQEKMIEALDRTNEILTAIARSLGASLPEAAEKGAAGVKAALDKLPKKFPIDIEFSTSGLPGEPGPEPAPPGAAHGGRVISSGIQYFDTSGIVQAGRGYFSRRGLSPRARGGDTVPIMAAPGELLLNVAHQGNLAAALKSKVDDGGSSGPSAPVDLVLNATIVIGGETLGTFTERTTWPQLKMLWQTNRGRARTDAQVLLEVK